MGGICSKRKAAERPLFFVGAKRVRFFLSGFFFSPRSAFASCIRYLVILQQPRPFDGRFQDVLTSALL
ncbi:hypothetical protein CHL67_07725 [Prosthecochloris sp. GSB1]|nr:hypothetical protein CHL67_07725 [Prosthecochloris sp. GSB1]